jgi:ferric-dicitrate binding protein FerR (iron transport regulator)
MKKEILVQSINQRINQSVRYYRFPHRIEKEAALNSVLRKIREEAPSYTYTVHIPLWARTVAAIAAVLILVFISGMIISTENVRNTGKEVVTLRLPDRSRVILADQSSVRFNKLFWNRKVNLKGKAYFEVKKGSTFQVCTPKGNVKVLGTRFLVEGKIEQLQVICFEGKVKASFGNEEAVLVSGSGIRMNRDEKQVKITEKEDYPGIARFSAGYSNVVLDNVLKDLESFFGIKIDNRVKQSRYFTGKLDTGNLETALTIITSSLGLHYKIGDDNTVIIL